MEPSRGGLRGRFSRPARFLQRRGAGRRRSGRHNRTLCRGGHAARCTAGRTIGHLADRCACARPRVRAGTERRRRAGTNRCRSGSSGLRLHGGRAEEDRLRVRRHQSGIDVPGAPRIPHQLRQEHGARDPDLPARRGRRRDGARLRQGRRQADAGRRSRDRRTAALVDGAVSGLGRSRARRRDRRPSPQSVRRDQPAAQRAGHGPARAQLRQVRRRGDDTRAIRGVGDARLQDRDDAADGTGRADGRRRAAGVDRHQRAAHSGARALHASARRSRRGPRSGAPARRR